MNVRVKCEFKMWDMNIRVKWEIEIWNLNIKLNLKNTSNNKIECMICSMKTE